MELLSAGSVGPAAPAARVWGQWQGPAGTGYVSAQPSYPPAANGRVHQSWGRGREGGRRAESCSRPWPPQGFMFDIKVSICLIGYRTNNAKCKICECTEFAHLNLKVLSVKSANANVYIVLLYVYSIFWARITIFPGSKKKIPVGGQ